MGKKKKEKKQSGKEAPVEAQGDTAEAAAEGPKLIPPDEKEKPKEAPKPHPQQLATAAEQPKQFPEVVPSVQTPMMVPPVQTPMLVLPVQAPTLVAEGSIGQGRGKRRGAGRGKQIQTPAAELQPEQPKQFPEVVPPVQTPTVVLPLQTPMMVPPVQTPMMVLPVQAPTLVAEGSIGQGRGKKRGAGRGKQIQAPAVELQPAQVKQFPEVVSPVQAPMPAPEESIGKGRAAGRAKPAQVPVTELQPGMRVASRSAQPITPQRQEIQPEVSFGVDPQFQISGGFLPQSFPAPQPVLPAAFPQGARQRPIHDQQSIAPQPPRSVPASVQQPAAARQQTQKSTPGHEQPPRPKQEASKLPAHTPPHAKTPATPQPAKLQKPKDPFEMQAMGERLPRGGQLMPPRRKNYGSLGRPIRLRANHLAVKFDSQVVIHHYDVEIKPELKNMKGLKRLIIQTMISSFQKQFIRRCVFDGEKNLFTTARLPFKNDTESFEVTLPSDNPKRKPRMFVVTLKIASYVRLSDLQMFLEGLVDLPPQNAIQALDIVLRHMPTEKYISLGRSIFPEEFGPDIGGGVQMWTGYYQSLRPQWKALHLNLDVSHRTFFRSQPVMDYACELLGLRNYDEMFRLHRDDWEIVAKELKGLKIEVTHTYPVKRSYRIIGLSKQAAEFQTFPLEHEGKTQQCTVAKYFLDMYKKPLRYAKLPCLQAQPADKHRYLPLEFCMIPVGQQCKKPSDTQTAAMIKKSAKPAPEREQKIRDLLRTTAFSVDQYAKEFGLQVSERLMDVPGRIIPPPGIKLEANEVNPRRGVWDMRSQKFFKGVDIKVWGIFSYCRLPPPVVQNFAFQLMKVGEGVGSKFAPPIFSENMRPDANSIEESFLLARRKNPEMQLIICILPGKTPLYAEVKRVADTVVGILTQCIQSKNVQRTSPATLTNIMMKINAKMDGTNSILGVKKSDVLKRPVIILGADVTHPPAGDKTKPSIAAIVASMDQNAQVYRAKVLVQEHRVEIITDLKLKVRELLVEFRTTLRCKPEKIIFYRDGVGEGQFYEVLRHELIAIRAACSSLEPDYKPAITFLVVQKRHHTRLFCENECDADGKAQNVPPGTTVDRVITHPTENDFYLCSHQGIQGTSRPTHYHLLWDDSNFDADTLQLLTYQLCHTYVRCTRSVSIPAPAYYAHLVAFRARYHLEKLQRNLDREGADPESYIERMQAAVEAHEKLGKMYYV